MTKQEIQEALEWVSLDDIVGIEKMPKYRTKELGSGIAEIVEDGFQECKITKSNVPVEIRKTLITTLEFVLNPWRDIESAPKDGTVILGARVFDGMYQAGLMSMQDNDWWQVSFQMSNLGIGFTPTHWMPLPSIPERNE